jgi:Kef-type K+ transport system membrane component KefB
MEIHYLLFQLALILLSARVCAEVAARLGAPTVIGELVAGILLGPSLLGWVRPDDTIKLLAEIGIILLLFEVGLETDVGRLIKAGSRAIVVALGGFVLPFLLGFASCKYLFGMSTLVSLFVGGTLTATSIGITVRILADLGRQKSREGEIILGAAVLDDVMGVVLLAVLYDFSVSGEMGLMNAGKVMLFIGLFFVLAPIAAKLLSLGIKHFHDVSASSGVIPVMLISLVLLFAALAHSIGAPELLGGFAAGVALSRRFFLPFAASLRAVDPAFDGKVHNEIKPIIQVFTPIFFVMVGLSLDLSAVDWSSSFIWAFSLFVLLVAVVSKMTVPMFIAEPLHHRIAVGIAMVPRGEVGLIFAELGRVSNIFDNETYAAVVMVIAYTTLLTPFWIKAFYRRFASRFPD